jgi:hypothetical protein
VLNAGSALMPEPVLRAIQDHLALESRIGGYEAHDASLEAVDAAYRAVADLLGAEPRNVAFTDNATASFMQDLSSIPFERGDVILTTRNDYISNQIVIPGRSCAACARGESTPRRSCASTPCWTTTTRESPHRCDSHPTTTTRKTTSIGRWRRCVSW